LSLAGDADGNLGDRATLKSMYEEIRTIYPHAGLTLVLSDRIRAERDAYIVPRGLHGFPKLCTAASQSDMVLCGEGGLFQDDDNLIKMPSWGLRVLLMRLLCRRVIGYSLGIGPLNAPTSRLFARLAFTYLYGVRDCMRSRGPAHSTRAYP
jgi:polysaccharide pyruvyl transferase WcaK-like protein